MDKKKNMRICIAGRGNVKDPILWSGTPRNLYDAFTNIPSLNIDILDWSIFKPIFSLYCVVYSKFFFTWGAICDPLLYRLGKRTINKKIKCLSNKYDYVLFCSGDLCITNSMRNFAKFAYYTDIYLADVVPYYKRKKWGVKSFLKQYNENLKEQYNRCDFIFTQNEWTRQSIIDKLQIPSDKVINVHFGVNLTPYIGEKDYSRNLLLIVLRKGLEEYKGLYLLLDAFKILYQDIKNVELAVVGTDVGDGIEGVTCYYNQPRETTVKLFQESTLYVMPAIREPNGITYLEGLANKSPIVGLNRFAFPEFSGYGEWGFLCENDNPNELAGLLKDALSDKYRLKEMGLKGQKFVEKNFKWEVVVDRMLTEMNR